MTRKNKIVVIDCETDPFMIDRTPEPFVWGYYDGAVFEYFWGGDCTQDICEFIYNDNVTIYAHNGGKFDFFYLLPWMKRERITVINGRISQAHIGEACLKDSYNLIPIPLSAYKKDDFEYWKMEREHREKHKKEILRYLENDCIYLYELVTAFIDRFGAKLTLASAAMNELKKVIEDKSGKKIDKFNKFEDEKFREFYYGGRCQAFVTGEVKGPRKIYDINSAYAYSMTQQHPDPTSKSFVISSSQKLPKNPCYFAIIDAVSRGALPLRDEKNDFKLHYPSDNITRRYYTTGWEIQAGIETGTLDIKRVIEQRVPRKFMDFTEYIQRFQKEKVEGKLTGDKIKELFAKLMNNSAYGKWALNPDEFKEFKIVNCGDYPISKDDKEYTDDSDGFNGFLLDSSWPDYGIDIYKRDDPKERGYYNVSIAASITGFVRAYLWRAICNSDDAVYCDTDSIICKDFLGAVSETDLGAWKYEGTAEGGGYIVGRKLYSFYTGTDADPFDYAALMRKYKESTALRAAKKSGWKIASKGSRLLPHEIKQLALSDESIIWHNDAPTFSLKFGSRFIKRKIKKTR